MRSIGSRLKWKKDKKGFLMTEEEIKSLFDALNRRVVVANGRGLSVSFESNVFMKHEDVPNPNAKIIGESLLFRIGETPKDMSQ